DSRAQPRIRIGARKTDGFRTARAGPDRGESFLLLPSSHPAATLGAEQHGEYAVSAMQRGLVLVSNRTHAQAPPVRIASPNGWRVPVPTHQPIPLAARAWISFWASRSRFQLMRNLPRSC